MARVKCSHCGKFAEVDFVDDSLTLWECPHCDGRTMHGTEPRGVSDGDAGSSGEATG